MQRNPHWKPLPELWEAHRDNEGRWRVVDPRGADVLAHPDPEARVANARLLAASPLLRRALQVLVRRLRAIVPDCSSQYHRDAQHVQLAEAALVDSRPTWSDLDRARDEARQLAAAGELRPQLVQTVSTGDAGDAGGGLMLCSGGLHEWGQDWRAARRCCDGWYRELRPDGVREGDDPHGVTLAPAFGPRAVVVWVKAERRTPAPAAEAADVREAA